MKLHSTLFVVPTPIGNLQDMTFRAIEILKSVSLVLAEDTRTSSYLLNHFGIETQTQSYHKFNEKKRTVEIIDRLKSGDNIALISDAGTPGISDPGYILIKDAIDEDINVVTLPGATAFIPALVSSGLETSSFCFIGFLPEKNKQRNELLESLKSYKQTIVFYCSPHDLFENMKQIKEVFGNRKAVVCKEISKLYETFYRGTLDSLTDSEEVNLKGEFILLVEGFQDEEISDEMIELLLIQELENGLKGKEAVKKVANDTKMRKNLVYDIYIKMKEEL